VKVVPHKFFLIIILSILCLSINTYNDGKHQTDQPCLKDDGEILLKVSDDPTDGTERNDQNMKNDFRQFLSFKVHDDDDDDDI